MARTSLPITTLTAAGAAAPAGTAIDQANGMVISTTQTGFPAARTGSRLILEVFNTFAGIKTVIVRAGAKPPAQRSDLGDLTANIAASTGRTLIGPLDTSRFAQADGSINVDFGSGTTGTVNAYLLPVGA